jgi:hypothetical protein
VVAGRSSSPLAVMSNTPPWIQLPGAFRHRREVENTLQRGGSARRDERSHGAEQLLGLYQLRLRIARDRNINPRGGAVIEDLADLVENLQALPGGNITAWFVYDADKSTRYWVFEDQARGCVIGCLTYDPGLAVNDG